MNAMASQVTVVSMVCPAVCSGADQRKHQISESLAFVRGIHRWSVNFPHKRPLTRKMSPFDAVIMQPNNHTHGFRLAVHYHGLLLDVLPLLFRVASVTLANLIVTLPHNCTRNENTVTVVIAKQNETKHMKTTFMVLWLYCGCLNALKCVPMPMKCCLNVFEIFSKCDVYCDPYAYIYMYICIYVYNISTEWIFIISLR